jgi:16S rRNA processing protein RimM
LANTTPITLAVIIGAHGVMGEVRLKLYAEGLESLKAHQSFNDGALTLKSLRPGNNGSIARFAEITDRNGAEAARGTELSVPRDALPPLAEGEYYHADVIGIPFSSDDGEAIGVCVAIENFGAGDVIEIERPGGKRFMAPMTAVTFAPDQGLLQAAFVEPDREPSAARPARSPKSRPK